MEFDPFSMNIPQSNLLGLQKSYATKLEFSPDIWSAAEALSSPDLTERSSGLDYLEKREAAFFFPLVAYLLSTRLCDSDLEFRARVIKVLANTLEPKNGNVQATEEVIQQLHNSLSQMRTRQIYALLEVAEADPEMQDTVAILLNYCSFAGEHLSDLLSDRKTPLNLRKVALQFVERIGYLDALSTLERLHRRLKSKVNGHKEFREDEEFSLIPLLEDAIDCLTAP
jgi:hypothetical protein